KPDPPPAERLLLLLLLLLVLLVLLSDEAVRVLLHAVGVLGELAAGQLVEAVAGSLDGLVALLLALLAVERVLALVHEVFEAHMQLLRSSPRCSRHPRPQNHSRLGSATPR